MTIQTKLVTGLCVMAGIIPANRFLAHLAPTQAASHTLLALSLGLAAAVGFFLVRTVSDHLSEMSRSLEERNRELAEMRDRVADHSRRLQAQNDTLAREIADREASQNRLEKSEERFRLAMEASRDGVWDWDVRADRVYYSPGYARMLEYSPKEFPPNLDAWRSRVHPDDLDRALKASQDCIDNRVETFSVEFRMQTRGADWRWFLGRGKVVERDEKGKALRMVGTHTDISRLKQSEMEKLELQALAEERKKMALVGQIAGKMAHDFNNVLGIIMSNAEFSLMDCQDPEVGKTLKLIFDQTVKGKNLTKNLVAFARDSEPKQAYFDLNAKIGLVLNLMKKELDYIDIVQELDPDLPELLADPGMIEHALINLVQNAVHALGKTDEPEIILKTRATGGHILIEIHDNGCGIPKAFLERVFEPAFTLKGAKDTTHSYDSFVKGTGYGLSNVRKYVIQHKGKIRIDSAPDQGTSFVISLPLVRKSLTQTDMDRLDTGRVFTEKHVLLVEDEAAIADVQSRIMGQAPFRHTVDIALNAEAAMALFDRNPDAYHLASLDFVLPNNMNGMDVYTHIRKQRPLLPILFISGNIEFLESVNGLEAEDPLVAHLSKPCQNLDYINCINRLLARAEDAAADPVAGPSPS